jgi:hypothetical protein
MTLGIVENDTEEFKLHHRGKKPGEVFQHPIQIGVRGNNAGNLLKRLVARLLAWTSVIFFQIQATLLWLPRAPLL